MVLKGCGEPTETHTLADNKSLIVMVSLPLKSSRGILTVAYMR